jgi:hypothetical protein
MNTVTNLKTKNEKQMGFFQKMLAGVMLEHSNK